jgi:isoleucyl-tRNA synthetase
VPESVHLCDWPEYKAEEEDVDLDDRMDLVIRAVSMGRALRTAHGLKVRQPLRAIHLVTRDPRAREALASFTDLIREELNVKEVLFDDRESELVDLRVKANYKSLGPRLGRDVQAVAAAIEALPVETVLAVEAGTEHEMQVGGLQVRLGPGDIVVERREKKGLFAECSGPLTVALDHELTPELVEEGLAREFVNRVQSMRKEADLHVADRIRVRYHSGVPDVRTAVERYADVIRGETLATGIEETPQPPEGSSQTQLGGQPCHIRVEKIEVD